MPVRKSTAEWIGNLKEGKGTFKGESGSLEGSFSFGTRFETVPGTNPEELIGAAHASCYSMALAHRLTEAGFPPERIQTTASVQLDKKPQGFLISGITLESEAAVAKLDERTFQQYAEETKLNCPVSKALSAVPIVLKARLKVITSNPT